MTQAEARYHPRGFGLKPAIEGSLRLDYHSRLVEEVRAAGNQLSRGDLTIRLAEEFGFCYGVDRAVEYAYEARAKFPDRRIFMIGEIIHNPHVNSRLRDMGILFLDPPQPLIAIGGSDGPQPRGPGRAAGSGAGRGRGDAAAGTERATAEPVALEPYAAVGPEDVVIIPAFGVPVRDLGVLRQRGCILVDTTCGSVLNVWKNVERYAREGFTSIIHGKYWHEETRATASRAVSLAGGHYLVLRDLEEARLAARAVTGNGHPGEFVERFRAAASPGFDPARHLDRLGLANQTTMLSSESLEIGEILRRAMVERWGEEEALRRFRAFDTICSATQERQDAVLKLLESPLDLMLVVGGYNSSNTSHLAEMASGRVPTYHIEDAQGLVSADEIHHKPVAAIAPRVTRAWLPRRPLKVGLTAGASTPNSKVGEVIERLAACCGISL
jgi:4-hydroxy-3-methylbut-2-enyl diphosphate reductase